LLRRRPFNIIYGFFPNFLWPNFTEKISCLEEWKNQLTLQHSTRYLSRIVFDQHIVEGVARLFDGKIEK
jgi:hypothetical protein